MQFPVEEPVRGTTETRGLLRMWRTLRRTNTAHTPRGRRNNIPRPVPKRFINQRDLTGDHAWDLYPAEDMDFDTNVNDVNNRTFDMYRFRQMMEREGIADANGEWLYFVHCHHWFRIPRTIRTDRTFARDEQDAIYLDHMDRYLHRIMTDDSVRIRMRNLPLVATGYALFGRWWNRFAQHYNFVIEAVWRAIHGLLVPADAETVATTTENFREYEWIYPATPEWFQEIFFPSGVPVPTPPSVYYYHWELMNTADARMLQMWHDIIELEFVALFIAAWWHEATRGQRAFIVPEETIEWLRERAENIPIDPDTNFTNNGGNTTANYVLDRMLQATRTRDIDRNRLYFPGTLLRPSEFVWTTGMTGEFFANAVGGREFVRGQAGGGRILELHVERDEYGGQPRINHNRPRPRPTNERAPQRRRVDDGEGNPRYRDVQERRSPSPRRRSPSPRRPPPPPRRPSPNARNSSPRRTVLREYQGPYRSDAPAPPPARVVRQDEDPTHPAAALTHRQALYRHNAPTEPGREEVYIDEWRRRYGEPTSADVRDARITTPAEDREIRNGQLGRQPHPVQPGARPRLVLSNNPRARRRPVPGGRIPKGSRRRTGWPAVYPHEAVHYRPRERPLPETLSEMSEEEEEDREREEYFDDGQHHYRPDQGPDDRDDMAGGGGGAGGGMGSGGRLIGAH